MRRKERKMRYLRRLEFGAPFPKLDNLIVEEPSLLVKDIKTGEVVHISQIRLKKRHESRKRKKYLKKHSRYYFKEYRDIMCNLSAYDDYDVKLSVKSFKDITTELLRFKGVKNGRKANV